MIKNRSLTFLSLCFLILLLASTRSLGQVNVSFTSGFLGSRIDTRGSTQGARYALRFSAQFGVLTDFALTRRSAIRSGLIYSSRGSTLTPANGSIPYADRPRIKLDYIELPVMYMRHGNGFEFFVGPQLAKLIRARVKGDGQNENIKDFVESTTVDLKIGVGLGGNRLKGQIFYARGITPAFEEPGLMTWFNNTFGFNLAYRVTDNFFRQGGNNGVPHREFE